MKSGSLLYDVFVLGQAVGAMLTEALLDAPLTPSEYAVYSFLFEHPQCTPTEMAQGLGMPMQTTSDWLANLKRRKHISTARSATDGRSYTVTLTPLGIAAQKATNRLFEKVNANYLAALPKSERSYRSDFARLIAATTVVTPAVGAAPH
jgi:DNA-binding MarR family transcriptional regulator